MEGDQAQLKPLRLRFAAAWRRARGRPRLLILAAVLALTAVLLVVLRPGPDLREGSEELEPGPIDVTSSALRAYGIVYRVEIRSGDDVAVSTDRVLVQRPFNARFESLGGPPPGERRISTATNAFGRFRVRDDVVAVPPDVPDVDRRPDASLEEMVERGYAAAHERRRVARRVCRVYRIAGDPSSTELAPLRRVGGEYTDVCIDEAGLVLEEASFVAGDLSTRRVAVDIDESPRIDDGLFELDEPTIGVREGGGSLQEVDPESRLPGGPFWDLREAPEGFKKRGRFAVVPPQPGFEDPTQRSSIVTLMTDVWTDGIDVLLVERGATQGGVKPFEDDPNARRVRLGELGRGELRYGLRTSEVRVRTHGGRFVRVAGTLPPSKLVSFARALEPLPEGPLIELD